MLPGQNQTLRLLYWTAAYQQALASAQGRVWADDLDQYQAIYEELLISSEWAGERGQLFVPDQQRLSVRALTRDLAGWSPPQPVALGISKA
ncbi:MAG: hypothetical protein ACRYFX_12965 [Janthinobacterium lividum]